ncbi:HoxN/HupN/NixA family nickel/cobalt transporter [Dyella halodurans]|uniref:Nickel/cobalt efflux system n=1 Tax=Dyella halodurans TaxID=1920171 RepID=A0ABV9C2J4_9GAMM|nr:HoxN/HupN/NixA family nickel/cobalt transporter [Dyella halodurans]
MSTTFHPLARLVEDDGDSPKHDHALTRSDWWHLIAFYGFIGALHLLGWGFYLHFSRTHPALIGLGLAAYLLGMRHAFDADHIAAIDDTVRLLVQRQKPPLGVGFYFSLGHSTVVLLLSFVLIVAGGATRHAMPALRHFGGIAGVGVSAVFLLAVGVLNLRSLVQTISATKQGGAGHQGHMHIDELVSRRGFMARLLRRRFDKFVVRSWQMYPIGLLFGLGFDTASEVGLLATTAGASASGAPFAALVSLPILFAAGMSFMDTTDGVLMFKAYRWAFVNPLRRTFYNITITGISVIVALIIGTIELLQAVVNISEASGSAAGFIEKMDISWLGFAVVGILLLTWLASVVLWRLSRLE